jgi:hypothetical protein
MRIFGRALVAAAFACSVAVAIARAEISFGALYLTTLPDGADVWLDGTYVGRSPVLVDALSSGHHVVTLTKTGWVTREVDVAVAAGSTAMSSLRLAAQHSSQPKGALGAVTFRSLEPGARVAIDGDLVKRDPQTAIPMKAGSHIAVVTTPAESLRLSRAFTVYPNTTTQVVVRSVAHEAVKSAVVAPAEEFLPDEAYRIDGKKVMVRYGGHVVVARIGEIPMRFDGATVSYDAAPSRIGGRLYLPLALLMRLTDVKTR